MTISMHLTTILLCLAGLAMYLLPTPPKLAETGRLAFFGGLLGVVWMLVT